MDPRLTSVSNKTQPFVGLQLSVERPVHYLVSRGLPPDLHAPENQQAHLLGQAIDVGARAPWSTAAKELVDPCAGIGAQTWYDQLTAFFKKVGAQLADTDPASAAQLQRASTH